MLISLPFILALSTGIFAISLDAIPDAASTHVTESSAFNDLLYPELQVDAEAILAKRKLERRSPTPTSAQSTATINFQASANLQLPTLTMGQRRTHQRVQGFLSNCRTQIKYHSARIQKKCGQASTSSVKLSQIQAQKLAESLMTELRALLDILTQCIKQIKGCDQGPLSSNSSGYTPPVIPIIDLCSIFFEILCELRSCFKQLSQLCREYNIIKGICQLTLSSISDSIACLLKESSIKVGGFSLGLKSLFPQGDLLNLGQIGFGFSSILDVLLGN